MAGLRGLVQALEDDLEWIEAHSRLANRARDWDEGGRATNRLMSGPDIAAAKRLIETRKVSAPPMLPVQLDFIQASKAHEAAQKSEREQELEEKRRLAEEALAQSRKAAKPSDAREWDWSLQDFLP
jgi:spore germination cell wall hydrolase CwlJ-like protein